MREILTLQSNKQRNEKRAKYLRNSQTNQGTNSARDTNVTVKQTREQIDREILTLQSNKERNEKRAKYLRNSQTIPETNSA